MKLYTMRVLLAVVATLILTACGTGGSGNAQKVFVESNDRKVDFPGSSVNLHKASGSFAPGRSVELHMTVVGTPPAAMSVGVGDDWTTVSPVTALGAGGIWTAIVVCPDPLPSSSAVLLRLVMQDGDTWESALTEAPISGM